VRGAKAAATAAAFIAVLGAVGAAAYATAKDDPPPTTTTTTTVRPPTSEEVAEAVTVALSEGLEVPLERSEAACVAGGLMARLGIDRLEAMAADQASIDDLTDDEHDGLVRAVVLCVPPEKAEAMLSTKPPPPAVDGLPDEGAGG
jgi:hypothetical protein